MLYEKEGPPLYDHLDQVRPTPFERYGTYHFRGTMVGTCSTRRRDHCSMIIWIRLGLLHVRGTGTYRDFNGTMLCNHLDQVRPALV